MKQQIETKCPKCKMEYSETFFKPENPTDFDRIEIKEGRRIGYKYLPNHATRINPYIDGGTFLQCKNCCLYTFYPRLVSKQ